MMFKVALTAGVLGLTTAGASAQIRITEWTYQGVNGEWIELTNVGAAPIDMTGWSYDDDSRLPGVLDLSAFGIVQPGETAIIVDILAGDFRTFWGLPASQKVIGGNVTNLGRNDEINIFNGVDLVDRLTFGDQNFPGTIRTQNRTGNCPPAALGANDVAAWTLSSIGDGYGTYASIGGDLGNPGVYVIPAPGAAAVFGLGLLASARRRR